MRKHLQETRNFHKFKETDFCETYQRSINLYNIFGKNLFHDYGVTNNTNI